MSARHEAPTPQHMQYHKLIFMIIMQLLGLNLINIKNNNLTMSCQFNVCAYM